MRFVIGCVGAIVATGCLIACGDVHERMQGYPSKDTVLNLDTATPNQIADALSQLARISTVGDDWEFLDPEDTCTVHVIDKAANSQHPLDLRGASFSIHRDMQKQHYYTTMKNGDVVVQDAQHQPLRLFQGETYHDVFFAEGYLLALAQKCEKNRALHAKGKPSPNS